MLALLVIGFVVLSSGLIACLVYLQRAMARRLARALLAYFQGQLQKHAARRAKQNAISVGQAYVYNLLQILGSIFCCILALWLSDSILVFLLCAGTCLWIPGFLRRRKERGRKKKIENALPSCLLMLASSLKSGASLSTTIQTIAAEQKGPLADEFALLVRDQKLGVDFDEALQRMDERIDIADFRLVVVALRVSREVGGNLSEILISLSQTIKNKLTLEGKIDALTAQGRIQGIVMALMPLPIGAALLFLEHDSMIKIFTTTIGHIFLGTIVILEFIGYRVIQKILKIDI
jgi:tight adherence protein B